MALKMEFVVFWVVVICSAVVGYQLSEDHVAKQIHCCSWN